MRRMLSDLWSLHTFPTCIHACVPRGLVNITSLFNLSLYPHTEINYLPGPINTGLLRLPTIQQRWLLLAKPYLLFTSQVDFLRHTEKDHWRIEIQTSSNSQLSLNTVWTCSEVEDVCVFYSLTLPFLFFYFP